MQKFVLFSLALLATCNQGFSQKYSLSGEVDIRRSEMYGLIGKLNDRFLLFYVEDGYVNIQALDEAMHKIAEKQIEPEKKNTAKVFDVLSGKNDFCLIYQYRKQGRNFVKIEKYDSGLHLLDSASVFWSKARGWADPIPTMVHSDDRRVVMFYTAPSDENIEATAVNLENLKVIQSQQYSTKGLNFGENFKEALVSNTGDIFFAWEHSNRNMVIDKHVVSVAQLSAGGSLTQYALPMKETICTDIKFTYDNLHNRIIAGGLYTKKGGYKSQGYFTTILNEPGNPRVSFHPFDDVFISSVKGRKVSNNKGIDDIKVQEIAFRKDGGILLFVEQIEKRARSVNNYMYQPPYSSGAYAPGTFNNPYYNQIDYYYDNIFVFSTHPDGEQHWRTVLYKKQNSENDDGAFCSYFLMKTPSALRLIFNDDIQKGSSVSEYDLNALGQYEHHILMNTEGQNLSLRFHDAMQVAANEIVVPSEEHHRLRFLKMEY